MPVMTMSLGGPRNVHYWPAAVSKPGSGLGRSAACSSAGLSLRFVSVAG
jgi:hypothetical protein